MYSDNWGCKFYVIIIQSGLVLLKEYRDVGGSNDFQYFKYLFMFLYMGQYLAILLTLIVLHLTVISVWF